MIPLSMIRDQFRKNAEDKDKADAAAWQKLQDTRDQQYEERRQLTAADVEQRCLLVRALSEAVKDIDRMAMHGETLPINIWLPKPRKKWFRARPNPYEFEGYLISHTKNPFYYEWKWFIEQCAARRLSAYIKCHSRNRHYCINVFDPI